MNARIRHRAVKVATLIAALAGAASFSVAMPAAASATTGAGGLALTGPAHASMSLPTGYQELLNAHTNKCADVADKSTEVGHVVHQWSCHRDDNQLWKVEGNVNGFMLRNLRSQLCLTTNWPFTNGTEITQTQCGWESGAVAWQPQNDGDFIKWFNPLSGRCLDLNNGSGSDGAKIQLWDCSSSSNAQDWYFS